MKKFSPVPLLAVMFFAIGCQDSAPPEAHNPSGSGKGKLTAIDYNSIQNPDNYQNFYGVIHNAGLEYIVQESWDEVGDTIRPLTDYEAAQMTVAFLNSISDSLTNSDLIKLNTIALATLDSMKNEGNIDAAFAILNLSTAQISYYHQIITAIKDPSINSLSSMLSALSAIETNIIASSALSYVEKSFPLAIVAIAKHSAFYHAQFFDLNGTGLDEPSSNRKNLNLQQISEKERWKKVLEADAEAAAWGALGGFIAGGIRGAIGGLLTGGPPGGLAGAAGGALVGAAAGGVGGAIVGSGQSLTKMEPRPRED